ncbi:MAG: redoxin domain-containing protein, partial [Flavobacteriaceae bacterium]|nr:redoxin domain-containing protein [Flavobacteriaceae bacterium]
MKKALSLIATGLMPLAVVFLFMKFISLNLSHVLIVGVISLLLVSMLKYKQLANPLISAILIAIPLILVFYFLVIIEIPGLWPVLLIFLLTPALVFYSSGKILRGVVILVLIGITGFTALNLVPRVVAGELTELTQKPAPEYHLQNLLGGNDFTNITDKGSVIVLDFFGTWCAPCISEMEELKLMTTSIPGYNSDWSIIIACTDSGGDTPEKALDFQSKRELPFQLAYDS